MKKRVSSQDVANKAGVSRALVSYVLNDVKHVKIKDETRQRILEAAKSLGYHPDSMARAMKTNKSMSIVVVSRKDIAQQRFSNVLGGIQDSLNGRGYQMVITTSTQDVRGYPEFYGLYQSKKVDGVLFLSDHEEVDPSWTELVKKDAIPSVFIDYHLQEKEELNTVDIDYLQGSCKATENAIAEGYRNVVFITPDLDIDQCVLRKLGVEHGIMKHCLDGAKLQMMGLGKEKALYDSQIADIVSKVEPGDLIITAWISHGYKVIQQFHMQGKDIKKYGVLALAGDDFAEVCYPRLTTWSLPLYEIGYTASNMLLAIINNEPVTEQHVKIQGQYYKRDSL